MKKDKSDYMHDLKSGNTELKGLGTDCKPMPKMKKKKDKSFAQAFKKMK